MGQHTDDTTSMRLYRRAVREGWPVSAEMKEKVMADALRVLNDPSGDERVKAYARDTILKADGINLQLEKLESAEEHGTPDQNVTVTVKVQREGDQ